MSFRLANRAMAMAQRAQRLGKGRIGKSGRAGCDWRWCTQVTAIRPEDLPASPGGRARRRGPLEPLTSGAFSPSCPSSMSRGVPRSRLTSVPWVANSPAGGASATRFP
jgi:hypothetical protein